MRQGWMLLLAFGLGCSNPSGARDEAPKAALDSTLSKLAFDGIDERGVVAKIRLVDYAEPYAASAHLLVVRVQGGAWCGTCRWHAAHTSELASNERLRILDLVVADRDNSPATVDDLGAWRALVDAPNVATAADPTFALRGLIPASGAVLPLFVLVDSRTLLVVATLPNPDPEELAHGVDVALSTMDGLTPPPTPPEVLFDGIFHRNEWDMIHDVKTKGAPPGDPTNAAADSPNAAALGKALFFDKALSPSNDVSCATCHDPNHQWSDALPQAKGKHTGSRRTPRLALSASSRWQFWDGRADSLWAQALGPLENPDEMGSSRSFVAKTVAVRYAAEYALAFPDSSHDETRVFVNAGKAIAAFERTLRVRPNALDAYASGDFGALTNAQKQGLSVFMGVGCTQCHWGPRLTDDAFHVTRTPTGRADGRPDRGRADALANEFSSSSVWSGSPIARSFRSSDSMLGAFKTPSLRGVAEGAPYGHGGELPTLADVMASYGQGGLPMTDARAIGIREPWLVRFNQTAQWSIIAFLKTLSGVAFVP